MLYLRPSFTLPTVGIGICESRWDYSVLTREEFKKKYGFTDEQYDAAKLPE